MQTVQRQPLSENAAGVIGRHMFYVGQATGWLGVGSTAAWYRKPPHQVSGVECLVATLLLPLCCDNCNTGKAILQARS